MAKIVDRSTGDVIAADDHNTVKDYIEDATEDINTKSLSISGVSVIDSLRNISGNNLSGTNTGDQTSSSFDIKDLTDSTNLRISWSGKQDALGFTPENSANKGQNNGYAGLDSGGKVPSSQLPSTLLVYKGVWDADTNTPTLSATDTDKKGFVYNVSVAGTQFGIAFSLGDWAIYNDSGVLEKSDNSDDVVSVNGQLGTVVLDADDISDTLTTNKFVTSGDITKLSNLSGTNTGDQSSSDFDIKDLTDSTSLRTTWSAKQDALVSGTNIKSINSSSILSSGDVSLEVPLTFSTGLTRTTNTITTNDSQINHNSLNNTHNLTTDINHNSLTNYVANEHIDWTNATSNFKTTGTVTINTSTTSEISFNLDSNTTNYATNIIKRNLSLSLTNCPVVGIVQDHETDDQVALKVEQKSITNPYALHLVKGAYVDGDVNLSSGKKYKINDVNLSATDVGAFPNSMSTNKLLGRGTASTGVVEEITLGTNLSLSGTTLNVSNTLPSQSTHGGKFLRTDGTDASWSSLNLLNNTFLQGRNNANSEFVDIIKINTNDNIEFGGDVEFGTLLLSAQVAPSTPSADNAYVYVTASGTTPNRVIELKTKNELGAEVTLSSVVV